MPSDVLQPPDRQLADGRLGVEPFGQISERRFVSGFLDVAVAGGNGEGSGLAGGSADFAIGLAPRGNPDLPSPIEERFGLAVGCLVDDNERFTRCIGDTFSSGRLRHRSASSVY